MNGSGARGRGSGAKDLWEALRQAQGDSLVFYEAIGSYC
jgi:hypothetical protein